jgi:tetratricopeptide (TPR) repeat protein
LKAKEYLDEAEKIYITHRSILFERYLLRTSAIFRFEAGDYEECISTYEKLIEIERKSNIKQFIFWYYLIIGEAYSFKQDR